LKSDGIATVLERLVKDGRGEWADPRHTRCLIYYKTPEEWADLIYRWASDHGFLDSVCTTYEIQHGDLASGALFYGLDTNMIQKALEVLQKRGKAQIFSGSSDEQGVKFFR
jgi:ESCRT-II complex subunit VPS25